MMSVLDIGYRNGCVGNSVIDDCVHRNCHRVFGEDLSIGWRE